MAQFLSWLISWDGLSFVLMMVAYYYFVQEIKKPGSKEKVNVATWASWGALDVLLFFALLQTGIMLWTVPAYVIGVAWVICAAVKRGATFVPSPMDYFCASVVAIAICWWFIDGGPRAAIVLVALGCSVATVPLLQHLWKEPRSSSLVPWAICLVGTACALFSVKKWSLVWVEVIDHWLFPVTFFILSVAIFGVLLTRFLPKHKEAGPQRQALPTGYIG